jgi:hypothetical protein
MCSSTQFPLQGEIKSRPPVHRTFCPHTPAVAMDNALDGGEADAGPFELSSLVNPLECAKKFPGVSHVESGAIVPDIKCRRSFVGHDTDFNRCLFLFAREFPCVAKEVLQYHPQ